MRHIYIYATLACQHSIILVLVNCTFNTEYDALNDLKMFALIYVLKTKKRNDNIFFNVIKHKCLDNNNVI